MKILILGGTGAMGVPLVEVLAQRGHEVHVTTRRRRSSDSKNIRYLIGNAQNDAFLQDLLVQRYDVLIDFMIYSTVRFKQRMPLLLESVGQYFFFSSSRVYADAGNSKLTEGSPRLLDVTDDEEYFQTDEYALAKAREENLLRESKYKNWTIIRPYITYNNERLQLGVLEKEQWLQRALAGKKIVFSKDIAAKYTTLTWGNDVAIGIANLLGQYNALEETFHITVSEPVKWSKVCELYLDALAEMLGKRPEVFWVDKMESVMPATSRYQIIYDRLYDRMFNNAKVQSTMKEELKFTLPQDGLKECLENFVKGNQKFIWRDWRLEGKWDRLTGDKSKISDIDGWKNKVKYILYRYVL